MEKIETTLLLVSPRLEPAKGARMDSLLRLLGREEKKRFAMISNPINKRQFLTGRSLLRQALFMLTGSTEKISFTAQGPPKPTNQSTPWHFSISHSANRAACLVSKETAAGVDIEWLKRRRAGPDMIRQCLPLSEQARALKDHDYFLQSWTLREAAWKSTHLGINVARLKKLHLLPAQKTSRLPAGFSFKLEQYQLAAVFQKRPKSISIFECCFNGKNTQIRPDLRWRSIQYLNYQGES